MAYTTVAETEGLVTILAIGMPGASAAFRLLMYPDGGRAGVETIAGDLTRPADWAEALEGVDGIFLLSGYDGMAELLSLARDAGVRRAALLSGSSVDGADLDNAVTAYQARAEAGVRASGPHR